MRAIESVCILCCRPRLRCFPIKGGIVRDPLAHREVRTRIVDSPMEFLLHARH